MITNNYDASIAFMAFMRPNRSAAPTPRVELAEPQVVNTEERAENEVKAKRKNRTRISDTYTAGNSSGLASGSNLRKTLG